MAYDKLRDKAPIESERARHRRKKGRKRFVVERRFVGDNAVTCLRSYYEKVRKWHVFKRYEKLADAEQAMSALTGKTDILDWIRWEYRIGGNNG